MPEIKWQPNMIERAYHLVLLGLKEDDLAIALGVSQNTLMRWKHEKPGFVEAINKAKDEADGKVAESLYRKALGFSYKETTVINDPDKGITEKTITKFNPPDTTAAIFWLKNRHPDKWRDVWRYEHTGEGGGPIRVESDMIAREALANLTDEELQVAHKIASGMIEKATEKEKKE